jgi:predicted nucleotidyltransferase
MSRQEAIGIIKKYLVILRDSGINVQKAFLFGSCARDSAREESDIDVMLVSEDFDGGEDAVRAKTWTLTEKVDIRIEPYTIGLGKFLNDQVSPLLLAVKREGLEIRG